jgi:Tripartite tricarboxylate transporter TctB family
MQAVEADRQAQSGAAEQGAWARPVSARLGEVLVALALLAIAAFFAWQAALLPFGRVGLPGPGFFPFALGIALGLLALLVLYRAFRLADNGEPVFLGHRDVLIAVAALCAVAFAFENVDSYVVLGAFAAIMLVFVARAALWRVALGAILGMAAVWAVFNRALGVRLPVGEFWGEIAGFVAGWLPF